MREIRSFSDFWGRSRNVIIYVRDLVVNTGYAVKGRIENWIDAARDFVRYVARGKIESVLDDARDGARSATTKPRGAPGLRPGYQAESIRHVSHVLRSFKALRRIVDGRAGGFRGKAVLEVGAGFAMPQGGAFAALALAEGALQATAVDRDGPEQSEADPARAAFWDELLDRRRDLSVCGKRNVERVAFFGGPLAFARMDAAALDFPDQSFDLTFSTAVFEHLSKPKDVLRELRRVLKPGGRAVIQWNPFSSMRLGGHDIGLFRRVPWAHLRLSRAAHIRALAQVYADPALYGELPVEHRPSPELARFYAADPGGLYRRTLDDLNRLRVREFRTHVQELGWRVLWENFRTYPEDCELLTPELRRELIDYDEQELVLSAHEIVLEKISA
jgi:SAM-dependent methyltransferase